ncbi:hypothetical protein [Chryseobacterium sp. FH1]|uniref:hypothetical protein n=1 Tax=Chryseobacterium sp. FH1 TaxID=1233951 RepID=UPI0004E391DB|nr:hypothetical protein [Chryseobacterium sp. FH1]KFC19353.1 hypothetical protein IO90_08590 [Chryseobacterium sp. FH1]
MDKPTDFLIECNNPHAFDKTIQQLGPAVLLDGGTKGNYIKKEGYYVMRVFMNSGYIKFAVESQGYGKIIKELEELL